MITTPKLWPWAAISAEIAAVAAVESTHLGQYR